MASLLFTARAGAETRLEIESGQGRAGSINWQAAKLAYRPAASADLPSQWWLTVETLQWGDWRGTLTVDCASGGLWAGRPWCHQGEFEWQGRDGSGRFTGRLMAPGPQSDLAFALADGSLAGSLNWPDASTGQGAPDIRVKLADFDLASLPARLLETLGLSVLKGRVDGRIELVSGALALDLVLEEGAFDRADGLVAGAGLTVSLGARVDGLADESKPRFSLSLAQRAGELLAGPVYLPPPERPLELDLSGVFAAGEQIDIESLALDDGGLVEAGAEVLLTYSEEGWRLAELVVDRARLELPGAWQRWGDGIASSRGFGDLETAGEVRAAVVWRSDGLESLELALDDVELRDAAGRFAVASLAGTVARSAHELSADLAWDGLELFSLAFGGARLSAAGTPSEWQLVRSLTLPLLDGAVVVDRLDVTTEDAGARSLTLDARIEPLDMAGLTAMLGLPTFAGQLSGSFPGVRLSGERIAFSGGIDIQAFSGGIHLSDFVIERPFGSLPALAAQVEIDRLDLAELTGAFNFGHMGGQVSGWMRDLRLLDWRPVAMDARLYTHEDAPGRRISQRAVENLSRLGGGAAALGATLLRMFDEFPYRRAGLACRLDRNICHLDGVAPHPSGGFYIVEGRSLPRLDVVGHRRLVDWPRLVTQLVAITEG